MMEHLDAERLGREMATAVEADRRRKDVDDMKKRSVMTAKSYDEFKNLVACAQDGQKPLTSKEMKFLGEPGKREGYLHAAQRKQGDWRSRTKYGASTKSLLARAKAVTKNQQQAERGQTNQEKEPSQTASLAVPQTHSDFERQWRQCNTDPSARFSILVKIDAAQIFKVELDELGAVISTLHQGLKAPSAESKADAEQAAAFLLKLCAVRPFKLALKFLTDGEKDDAKALLDAFKQAQIEDKVVEQIADAFECK